jgi:hypothetical protein
LSLQLKVLASPSNFITYHAIEQIRYSRRGVTSTLCLE